MSPPTPVTPPRGALAVLSISDEVRSALAASNAVVALESTIIAHGLPYPDNLTIARELEQRVRERGATPATIAVLDGRLHVGLADDQLETFARSGPTVAKAGMTDLAVHLARRTPAATTVSATAWIAHRAGLRVFATGGIGGVHRRSSAHEPLDMSSDLTALAQLPIVVVSAGSKAILDIPATLEALETLGVLVLGYRTDVMPAFYTRSAGLPLEHCVDSAADVAAIARARFDLLGQGGILVANPIAPDAALDIAEVASWIDAALVDASHNNITGKQLTPFLLAQLAQRSGGRAVAANRSLALDNAAVAADIALALAAAQTS